MLDFIAFFGMILHVVRVSCEDHEVVDPVVGSIAVLMVDDLTSKELPIKVPFHYEPVLQYIFAIYSIGDVAGRVLRSALPQWMVWPSLEQAHAPFRATVLDRFSRFKGLVALSTYELVDVLTHMTSLLRIRIWCWLEVG